MYLVLMVINAFPEFYTRNPNRLSREHLLQNEAVLKNKFPCILHFFMSFVIACLPKDGSKWKLYEIDVKVI